MKEKYQHLKLACYSANLSLAIVANLAPILLITFRTLYGISYSLLGLLILVNFVTQLSMDILFSFFSHKFNISKTVKFMPVLTTAGFFVYALWPSVFPEAVYPGLIIGTMLYSASGGLGEVLISPVVASIPSEDPDREISKLHSVYAWGVVLMIIICTVFILLFGAENWQWLVLLLTCIPIVCAILFAGADIPSIHTPGQTSGALGLLKNRGIWLFILAMFCGGAAECTMGQWASGYLEEAMGIPKVWGDIFGVALFSVMLGLGRSLYGKYGKNIEKVLFFSAVGASLCYFLTAISGLPLLGLASCALTGFFTSMLWPGCLIVASEWFPKGGIFVYALMAAAGDLGASVGPQLVGIVTDLAARSQRFVLSAQTFGISPEAFGMKIGMLVAMLFPLLAAPLYFRFWKTGRK